MEKVKEATPTKDDLELINKSCAEYCNNYKKLISVEQADVQPLMDNITKVSHNLDTLKAHFESLRGDCELITSRTMPAIHSQLSQLQPIFDYIDKLERMIEEKARLVEDMESRIREIQSADVAKVDLGKEASEYTDNSSPTTTPAILKNITDLFT